MPVVYSTLSAFVSALAALVPDMKGGYVEEDFITEALDALAEEYPAYEVVDVGDGSTTAWALGVAAEPFAGFLVGFSDLYPVETTILDAAGAPYRPPTLYSPAPYLEDRFEDDAPGKWLVFPFPPAASAKARVRFARSWTVATAPPRFHAAIVKKAAAKKAAALSSFYKSSIDPAGGSDIFDARQYAESYAQDAQRWDEEFAKLVGLGTGGVPFAHGTVQKGAPTVFRPWGA